MVALRETERVSRSSQTYAKVLAAGYTRGMPSFAFALLIQKAQGKPDARCTRGLVCNGVGRSAHEHTGPAEAIRLSLRGCLRLIRGLLGEPCTFATVARTPECELDTSLRVVGTPRFRSSASGALVRVPSTSTAFPPRVRNVRETPSEWDGMANHIGWFAIMKNRNIFSGWA